MGAADLAVPLTDPICSYLAAVVARDLGLSKHFPKLPKDLKDFYGDAPPAELALPGVPFGPLIERLAAKDAEAITFFVCLAALHKHRLKYARILERQPLPTMEQVGARGLLQYGTMSPKALTAFLLWRKWVYDIDNRAAQETGYLFEPIIALSVGGTPAPAKKSPVKRRSGKGGRQVDCLLGKTAYEIKMRVTIAASGQGRWGEELDFPKDCKASRYKPVLVVFDSTSNPKLDELKKAFLAQGGEVHVGKDAWAHLDAKAGKTMAVFLKKYVRAPIEDMLKAAPEKDPPDLSLHLEAGKLVIGVGQERYTHPRKPSAALASDPDPIPPDVDEEIPTP
ncbi:hypothetical protein [Hyalangium rubrum]|uniref:Restriction endonuclease n=1 Tax=Hyalangium rubrum TaxID=3103134 RepID=A0ABU5H853_9BACT|nr:hypothetical protein [Hyalangium sp. s54d21]MDY7229033.1 hypothetical protein [Hyalangium sp. s54d21]